MKKIFSILLLAFTVQVIAQTTLNVGIIETNLSPIDDMVTAIVDQTNAILSDHPNLDVVLTPEYSLFNGAAYENSYIQINKAGDLYELDPTNGDPTLINHINTLLDLADDNDIKLVLGTVPLKLDIDQSIYPNLNSSGVFNTVLFINESGEIFDYDLKVRGSDWIIGQSYPAFSFVTDINNYTDGYPIFEDMGVYLVADTTDPAARDAVKFTNQTTRVRSFIKEGVEFRYASITCAERHSFEMLDKYKNEKVDVVFYNEWEGYYYFDELMEPLQAGIDTSEFYIGNPDVPMNTPYGFTSFKRDLFREFINRNMIDGHTYLVATDSKNGRAGALRYNFEEIDAIDFSQKYVYVEIPATESSVVAEEKDKVLLKAFPNPVTNELKIVGINQFQPLNRQYIILNIQGQQVAKGTIVSGNFSIDVSTLKGGIYFIQVSNSLGNINSVKFVKK